MITIDPGSGYRLLTEGETVLASDEVYWGARWLAQTKWPEDIGQTWGISPACNLPRTTQPTRPVMLANNHHQL